MNGVLYWFLNHTLVNKKGRNIKPRYQISDNFIRFDDDSVRLFLSDWEHFIASC